MTGRTIVAALIVAGSILVATAIHIYFSPYQTCKRVFGSEAPSRMELELYCLENTT